MEVGTNSCIINLLLLFFFLVRESHRHPKFAWRPICSPRLAEFAVFLLIQPPERWLVLLYLSYKRGCWNSKGRKAGLRHFSQEESYRPSPGAQTGYLICGWPFIYLANFYGKCLVGSQAVWELVRNLPRPTEYCRTLCPEHSSC